MRSVGIIAVLLMLTAAGVSSRAAAQSPYCLPLQMELAELERSGSAGDSRTLRRELERARAEERRAGCRGLFSRQRSGSACRSIRSRITSLERQLGGYFGFGRSSADRQRERIRQALARNGCSTYTSSYRTICVRVCDGYYFPLSSTASRQRLALDAQKCLAQYGPDEAALFYHPFPRGDASQAVSLDGQRYFDQPYAFAFQSAFMPHCAAQLHQGLAALGQRVVAEPSTLLGEQFEAAAEARMETPLVPIPLAHPDWSSDPETLANRAGNLVPIRPAAPAMEIALVGKASRSVGDPYHLVEANPGPPPTVAGYKPPTRRDFRAPQRASIVPARR
jgi:hypothetical protein